MRILTVSHFYEAHGGGIERVAGHLNREFAALGHDTCWAASQEDALPASATALPVPLACWNFMERITGLPMPIPGPGAMLKLRRAIRSSDAVIVHDALYVSSIAAILFAKWAKKPVLLVQHIADVPLSNPLLQQLITVANRVVTRPMLRAVERLVFISDTVRRTFADTSLRHPSLLLFNGVDSQVFRPGTSNARAELDLARNAKMVLFVGRFVDKKGLAVVERVARARTDWHFVLAGRGPVDPHRWRLPNVIVADNRSGERLAALYRAADVLLLPSVGEGYPLVVQEAMACGLPVVCGADTAQADPGASRWLKGVSVDLSDVDGTAARVIRALEGIAMDVPTRMAMSAYAAQTYSWRDAAARMAEAIAAV